MQNGRTPSPHTPQEPAWQTLAEFTLSGELENEPLVLERVTEAVQALNLPVTHLERLKTVVAEATLNAIEHGNHYQAGLPVVIRVLVSEKILLGRVTAQGSSSPIVKPETLTLVTELTGQQPVRGWGFFLIEKMMDGTRITGDEAHHTIELFLYLEGGKPVRYPAGC